MDQTPEESNHAADSCDPTPNLGSQSPKSSPNADPDPDGAPPDRTVELRDELETQLRLEEGESKDENPSMVEGEVHEGEREQSVTVDEEDRGSIGRNQDDEFDSGKLESRLEEGESKDENPSSVEVEELGQPVKEDEEDRGSIGWHQDDEFDGGKLENQLRLEGERKDEHLESHGGGLEQNVREDEEDRGSIGWHQDDEVDSGKLETQLRLGEGQDVKEDEVDKGSIGWGQDDEFYRRESNGGGEEDHSYNYDKFGDGFEKRDEASNGYGGRHVYPIRPEAEDCSFYMKTGNCKFGSNCKFNHPVRKKNQGSKERVNEWEEGTERPNQMDKPNQTECKYYLRTGGCKYGKACRYNHSKARSPAFPPKTTITPVSDLNFLGLPIRPGERECPYYMRNGSCKYGANCRFNHPDPTAVGGSDQPSTFSNGSSASLQSSSQSNLASWSSPIGLNESPVVPIVYQPTGVPSPSPEWNGYQAPVYPPERSIHPHLQFLRGPTTDTNAFQHKQKISVDEFPERPGQPECSFYMKTGDCRFKSNCKYHHPKNHNSRPSPCIISDKGLPLRPGKNVCSYYSRYGICKFGPGCKFDHPIQPTPSSGSAEDEDTPYGGSVDDEEGKMAETKNGNGAAVEQSV